MEAIVALFYMLGAMIEIIAAVSHLGALTPEKPIRPRHEHPGEVNPPLNGQAIARYVSSTSTRAARDGGFLLANRGATGHPLRDRDVDG